MLIKTKLHPPSLRAGLLARTNLMDRLRIAGGSAVILISGPAGSGKTSLTCQWIEQEKLPVAWYSLDEEDNSPDSFFRYLLTALVQTDQQLKNALNPLLADGHALSAENAIPHLIDALSNLTHTIRLVLDDFHQITNRDIHDAVARFVLYMPDGLQVIVLSRYSFPAPVDAAVVKKDYTEITADELKFTETEALDLLRKVISDGFPVDRVRDLHRHMEGWAAGLQLIGLSIRSKGAPLDLSNILNRAHEQIANYLIHDILQMQPEKMREFVLATALLDRFNPELCIAVTGMQDAVKILARLESMNLFLIPLDTGRKWYRYHHMFSQAIRHQVAMSNPDFVTAILAKAANWLAQNDYLEDALRCAFQSKDFEFAADLMEDDIMHFCETLDLASGIRWISRLPESVLNQRALLRLLQCGLLSLLMELSDVKAIISAIENSGDPDFSRYSGERLALCQDLFVCFSYMLHIFYADETSVVEDFQALRNNINLQNPFLEAYIETHIVSILISKGDLAQAENLLNRLSTVAVPRHDHLLRKRIHHAQIMALISKHRGRLSQAEQIIQQVLDFFNRQAREHIHMTFFLHRQLGNIYYQQNRLQEAREYAANTLRYYENFGLFDEIIAGNELWLQLHLAAGEKEQATQCIHKIRAYAVKLGIARLSDSADVCAARLALDLGNLAAAGLWSQRRNLQPDEPFSLLFAMECLTQARLFYAKGQYEKAAPLLETLRNRCVQKNLEELVLHIDIVQSAVYHAMNRPKKAVSLLKNALVHAEFEGYIRPFVNDYKLISPVLTGIVKQLPSDQSLDHLGRVMVACGMPLSSLTTARAGNQVANLTLSQREIEILTWVAQGCQNKEIARKAFISITTVKSHVSNIMVKLNAKTRTQAVLKAKERNILTIE